MNLGFHGLGPGSPKAVINIFYFTEIISELV